MPGWPRHPTIKDVGAADQGDPNVSLLTKLRPADCRACANVSLLATLKLTDNTNKNISDD